ncbi:MAG: hypothetical protein ACLU77_15115 [Waltera sp.]
MAIVQAWYTENGKKKNADVKNLKAVESPDCVSVIICSDGKTGTTDAERKMTVQQISSRTRLT